MKLITGMEIAPVGTSIADGAQVPVLLPVQGQALEALQCKLAFCQEVALVGVSGSGRSALVAELARRCNGSIVNAAQFVLRDYAYRDRFQTFGGKVMERLLAEALAGHDLVVIDDYSRIQNGTYAFRPAMVAAFREMAAARGVRIVTVHDAPKPGMFESEEDAWRFQKRMLRQEGRNAIVLMEGFGSQDYRQFITSALGEDSVASIDFEVLHRYASKLRLNELNLACRLLKGKGVVDTDAFISCLERFVVRSNIRTNQIEALEFKGLPGSEEIVDALETHVVLPFENRALAQRLGVKPKRGVLLYGPPGTGKTSIGRALAHRMKGKFFMIDGSINTEPPTAFFDQFMKIVTLAKENAPAVLFIDDADVLFGIHHVSGLVRYLLSLLDGMESASASNVCVMMTAMDPRKVPDALMRSGRVELWLETRPPEADVRGRILERWNRPGLPDHDNIDYPLLGAMTEGFTPADLRRIAGDARLLYAADRTAGREVADATTYMTQAIREIVNVRSRMSQVLGGDGAAH